MIRPTTNTSNFYIDTLYHIDLKVYNGLISMDDIDVVFHQPNKIMVYLTFHK